MSIQLRDALASDAAAIRRIYAPHVLDSVVSFEEQVPSVATMAERMARATPRTPWLVAVRDEAVVGYAYATPWRGRPAYRHSVETTVYVDGAAHRQGVARALLAALLERLRAEGAHAVIAGVALPNEASVRLHEALGYRPVGVFPEVGRKRGRWVDVGFWSLILGSRDPAVRGPTR